ncbi:hypothetical protein [Tsukamurella strandjordii]|uniref:Uncharacterized protein n=1 Tax=Tsukamurella strandjordii TaxID=147577 RepID=A0AA90NBN8_9ACTN|nr:hypothetical protein [Tsukamurella strandjordii]MDP0398755.1 hypothetical protein [Tsukamurella strandjordii]
MAKRKVSSAGRKATARSGRAWGNALGGYRTQARKGGKFAKGTGGAKVRASVAGAVKSRATGSATKARRAVGNAYVKGSFEKNLHVGTGGSYKGVKAGVEFRSPKGRGVLVKGIAGYHGTPNRRLDVTPSLDKPTRTLTVKVRPNPGRKTTAARSARGEPGRKVNR